MAYPGQGITDKTAAGNVHGAVLEPAGAAACGQCPGVDLKARKAREKKQADSQDGLENGKREAVQNLGETGPCNLPL